MNYLSLSTLFGATTPGEKTEIAGERQQKEESVSTPSIRSTLTGSSKPTPLSSLKSISTMRSRTNSVTSLSSLQSISSIPSCTSIHSLKSSSSSSHKQQTPEPSLNEALSLQNDNDNDCESNQSLRLFTTLPLKQNLSNKLKRRASTSMIGSLKVDKGKGEISKIKVTCNNCYLWRKKCVKQETKLNKMESELDRTKLANMEFVNKTNLNTKTFIAKQKEMNIQINEYKKLIKQLKQQNKDQLNKINDIKRENDVIKKENFELKQKNESLHNDVEETKEKGRKALSIIRTLKEKVIKIQDSIKNEDSQHVKDSKNPWLWVLRMT